MSDNEAMEREAEEIFEQIRPLLAGRAPQVQGLVLADLLAVWIAGHLPELRDAMIELELETIRELIPLHVERRRKTIQ